MHFFFGLVAYLIPIPIFTSIFFLYRDFTFHIRKVEITLSTILIYISLLMAQELILDSGSQIGFLISEALVPVTGIAGFVIVNFLMFIMALHLLFNLSSIHFSKVFSLFAFLENFIPKKESLNIRKAIFANEEHEQMIENDEKKRAEEIAKDEDENEKRQEIIEELKEEFKEELEEENDSDNNDAEKDHRQSIEEYIEQKKREIQQIDFSAVEDSNARKVNLVVEATKRSSKEREREEKPKEIDISQKESLDQQPVKKDLEVPFFEVNEVEEEEKEVAKESKVEQVEKEIPSEPKEESKEQELQVTKESVDLENIDEEILEKPSFERKTNVKIVKELEENKKILENIEVGEVEKPKDFQLPATSMLQPPKTTRTDINEAEIDAKIEDLLEKLRVFKIEGDIVRTYSGPVVTTFEFKPAPHIKVSKILNLQDDIAMALRAQTIRIQAPIPGKDVVGIEIPNIHIETIYLREIIESELFQKASSPLTIVLGKDIVGNPFITDLRKLPHLLIAGTTGSGKSVGINAMILSLLYKNSPDKLKLLMVDPKMLEFSIYNDIPHLLTPVITQPKQAINAMANMVVEMDRRYALMAKTKTKTIESFNEKAKRDESLEHMPFIVVIIDELADLMMAGGKEVEVSIARLAQKARACGIHLVIATQRPSTDVITGLIKANLPSRLSYRVGSKIDSKVILDQMGADALLGRGDLLFTPPGSVGLVRVHAPWSTEEEIDDIAEFLKGQREVEYDHAFLDEGGDLAGDFPAGSEESFKGQLDELYPDAKEIVITEKKTSISYIQRKLGIGYNRSANIIEQLEQTGVLSAPNSKGQREVVGS